MHTEQGQLLQAQALIMKPGDSERLYHGLERGIRSDKMHWSVKQVVRSWCILIYILQMEEETSGTNLTGMPKVLEVLGERSQEEGSPPFSQQA